MCGCKGGGVTPSLSGGRPIPQGTKFLVEYPNGASTEFTEEWQAVQSQAISGGTIRPIYPAGTTFEAAPATASTAGGPPAPAPYGQRRPIARQVRAGYPGF